MIKVFKRNKKGGKSCDGTLSIFTVAHKKAQQKAGLQIDSFFKEYYYADSGNTFKASACLLASFSAFLSASVRAFSDST